MKKILFIALAALAFVACEKENSTTPDDPHTDNNVMINGVKWATRNVDVPGTFAAEPEDTGMFYQWNRKVAYPSTGDVTNWDVTIPNGTTWAIDNDPCPDGWRVPTTDEIQTLLIPDKVSCEWISINNINGRKFSDKVTGNSIILPAAGHRDCSSGALDYASSSGSYWSSTQYTSDEAYYLDFICDGVCRSNYYRRFGFSVRCVAE